MWWRHRSQTCRKTNRIVKYVLKSTILWCITWSPKSCWTINVRKDYKSCFPTFYNRLQNRKLWSRVYELIFNCITKSNSRILYFLSTVEIRSVWNMNALSRHAHFLSSNHLKQFLRIICEIWGSLKWVKDD
jgi:hypothetical protein